ncbi:hypothetical protein TeGR_g6415 [Tetraparma gracilis]|uniref:Uncharacterized protein n=1 Tax=Tetraparma gracilis TaxID=2962635 RepID=A0ABQ6MZ95_9STRA|nr:hypothetical protein TeGR_g6415 [Tetraparma gracilis]
MNEISIVRTTARDMANMMELDRSNVVDYAELVVRDFLQAKGYFGALEALTEDVAAAKAERLGEGESKPESGDEIASWYIVNQHLGLPSLLHANKTKGDQQFSSVIEVLVDHMAIQSQQDTSPAPWVRPSTSPAFKFPLKASKTNNQVSSPPSSPDAGRTKPRPKSSQALQRPKNSNTVGSPQPTIKRQLKTLTQQNGPKISNQNWIPDEVRKQMVRRDMAVAKLNIENTVARSKAAASEKNKHKLNPLETSKSREKFGIERKVSCGLCCTVFLPVNLCLAVPLKAVLDIRDSWGDKFDPNFVEKQLVPQMSPRGTSTKMAKVNPNLRKAPLCYDKVRVCAFCAQLFQRQQDSYRPSYEAKAKERLRKEEEEDLAARKAYWDPLTTTENEKRAEMEAMRRRLEGGGEESGEEEEEEEVGVNVKMARKSLMRTNSMGRMVRDTRQKSP